MEEDKYYVPGIDEFFDKLEFEYKEYLEESDEYSDKWISVRFDARSGLGHDMTHQLYEETIRVKRLDKQDLVELGFEYLDESENGITYVKSNVDTMQQILLTKYYEEYRVGIALHDMDVELPRTSIQIGTFGGAIKNKSELIKVLKMLGIK